MNGRRIAPWALAGLLAAAAAGLALRQTRPAGPDTGAWVEVVAGPFELWSAYEGELVARNVLTIASRVNGPATITELAPEGARVRRGEVLARFDSFQVQQDAARMDREYAIAETELRILEQAVLPLERSELESALLEARVNLGAEEQAAADNVLLLEERLISAEEAGRQQLKVEGLRARVAHLEMRRRLMDEHLHPARLAEARAKLDAAARQRDLVREQLEHCTVLAPADGEVVRLPLPFGAELRGARVGDVVYRNQEFMCLPDPSSWIARCFVPEHELSRVRVGQPARMMPRAYPDLALEGVVEAVAPMAQTRPGAAGQRGFAVTIRVDGAPADLRSGLTAHLLLQSRRVEQAVLVPRAAVRWEDGRPHAIMRGPGGEERRALELGLGNAQVFEVRAGLAAGEWVRP